MIATKQEFLAFVEARLKDNEHHNVTWDFRWVPFHDDAINRWWELTDCAWTILWLEENLMNHGHEDMATPPAVFNKCVKRRPYAAIRFARKRLVPEHIQYCVMECPILAGIYLKEMLSEEQREYCRTRIASAGDFKQYLRDQKAPQSVIDYAVKEINEANYLRWYETNVDQEWLLCVEHLLSRRNPHMRMPFDLFIDCVNSSPILALRYGIHRMNRHEIERCLDQVPTVELKIKGLSDWTSDDVVNYIRQKGGWHDTLSL